MALLGGLVQINPVWLYGPYNPAQVSAGSQPDWYVGFLDGSTRLFPAWEIRAFDYTISPIFWPTIVLPGILFTLLALYPFIEARLTKDRASHNLLQRPRDVPVRTSLGAMALTFYVVLLISGGNDVIANKFDISLNAMTWTGRIAVIVLPPLAYVTAYLLCLGLQRPTARCSSTAWRPASSSGCRPASSSRCTSHSARSTSTATASWSTRARRCRGR